MAMGLWPQSSRAPYTLTAATSETSPQAGYATALDASSHTSNSRPHEEARDESRVVPVPCRRHGCTFTFPPMSPKALS
eukprot:CAMPEP_0177537118 /NCGR_PEP_ID=MMETSP0369-20130122/57594_1 /TAXON_ID=447022 ORGANISM="Scrippsiella hangoei-like, Strain SHHI-4" /NCGR_SAMPLE_ID=MMETSP0369 /ASSEMBLY_ACC=CAM_ASM_000364 /LENGTH=77 /DNA_ID=CAMNT_0019019683 /DNA_START=83 /DNA_END=316 /DNA_ORIENTATION=+